MNTVQSSFQLQRAVSGVFSTTFKSQPDRAHITPSAATQKPTETGAASETVLSPVPDRLYIGPPEMVFSPVPDRLYIGPPEMVFSPVPDQINGGTSKDNEITNDTIQSADNHVDDNSFYQTPISESAKIVKMFLEQHVYDKYFSDKEPYYQIIG
jgi:hypothetical protein